MALIKKVLYINEDIPSPDFTEQMQDDVINSYTEKYPDMIVKVYGFFTQDKNLLIFTDNQGAEIIGVPKMLKSSSINTININSLSDSMIQTYEFIITSDSKLQTYQDAVDIAQAKADYLFKYDNQRIPIINIIDYKFGNSLATVSASVFGNIDVEGNVEPLLGTTPESLNLIGGNSNIGKEKLEAINNNNDSYFRFTPSNFNKIDGINYDYSDITDRINFVVTSNSDILEDNTLVVSTNLYKQNNIVINTYDVETNNIIKTQNYDLSNIYYAQIYVTPSSNYIAIQEQGKDDKYYNNRTIILKKDSDGEYIEDSILEWAYNSSDNINRDYMPLYIKFEDNGTTLWFISNNDHYPKKYVRSNINEPFNKKTYEHPENYIEIKNTNVDVSMKDYRNFYTSDVAARTTSLSSSIVKDDSFKFYSSWFKINNDSIMSKDNISFDYDLSSDYVKNLVDPNNLLEEKNINFLCDVSYDVESVAYINDELKRVVIYIRGHNSGYDHKYNTIMTLQYNVSSGYYEIINIDSYETTPCGQVKSLVSDKRIITFFNVNKEDETKGELFIYKLYE